MSNTVDISSLPEHIQEQIKEAQRPPKPLFPIEPRIHTGSNFQTKEMVELGEKMDRVIEAVNVLHRNQTQAYTAKPTK